MFNGKELDEETELYYYGARYYDPKISMWYGVDPLAEKNIHQTPYNFVSNNPLVRIDPNGLTDYTIDESGSVIPVKGTEDKHKGYDMLYSKSNYDDGKLDNGYKVNDKNVLTELSKTKNDFSINWGGDISKGSYAVTKNYKDTKKLFEFVSKVSTNAEWALRKYKGNRVLIGTSHFSESVADTPNSLGLDDLDLQIDIHSHPGSSPVDDRASNVSGYYDDMDRAIIIL